MLSHIKKILPANLFVLLRKVWRVQHKFAMYAQQLKGNATNQQQLTQQLINAGIVQGTSVLVHSSLRKLGYVPNGAHTVIQALQQAIGEEGTLLMPAFPAKGYNKDYLLTSPVFNYHTTPSSMGIITEVFRTQYATHRSLHATDSVCAMGAKATYYTNTHFGQLTPYNTQSPFYKLCAAGGKILLLGVDLNSLTNFHTLEDAVPDFVYPVYDAQEFITTIINANNEVHYSITKVHNPAYSAQRKCMEFESKFLADGILQKINLGQSISYIIDAQLLHAWMLTNYAQKGITLYTPQGL